MKKRIIAIILSVVVLALLFVPLPKGKNAGGDYEYAAVAYKVAKWYIDDEDMLDKLPDSYKLYDYYTCVYWFPNSLHSLDDLSWVTWDQY